MEAVSDKKYRNARRLIIKNSVTFWTTILFGITTIILTVVNIALTKKNSGLEERVEVLEKICVQLQIEAADITP